MMDRTSIRSPLFLPSFVNCTYTGSLLLPRVSRHSDYTVATKLPGERVGSVDAGYAQGQLHSSRAPTDSV